MKLNQWKGFVQINKSSLHQNVLCSSLGLENQQIVALCCLSSHGWVYSIVDRSKGLMSHRGGMRGDPRLLFNPRPHLSLVLASSQKRANGTSGQNRLIKLANSKDNTDPNQSETPVERLWAGTQDTPWGCHHQGQVENRTVCYWACRSPASHFLISLVLPQTTTAGNIFLRNWRVWPWEGTV